MFSEAFSFTSAVTYLDATYDSFVNAACNNEQILKTSAGQSCTQDLSGKTLQFAPKWSANISAKYQLTLADLLILSNHLDINYSDNYAIANDLDENLFQENYYKINIGVTLSPQDDNWSVSLLAKNITKAIGTEPSLMSNNTPPIIRPYSIPKP